MKDSPKTFSPDQVKTLCGGRFPKARGFSWKCVHHFRLVEGVLEPCDVYGKLLPAPSISVKTQEDKGFWGVWKQKLAKPSPPLKTKPKSRIRRVATDLLACAEGWDADACLLGNVTAEEIGDLCLWTLDNG